MKLLLVSAYYKTREINTLGGKHKILISLKLELYGL